MVRVALVAAVLVALFILVLFVAPGSAALLETITAGSQVTLDWNLPNTPLDLIRVVGSTDGKEFTRPLALDLWGWHTSAQFIMPQTSANRFWAKAIGRDFFGKEHELTSRQWALIPANLIVVSIKAQRLWYVEGGKLKAKFKCSTGRSGYPSYKGKFKVYSKTRSSFSRLYDVWMHYCLWVHRGMAIHASDQISRLGTPASHGCIRLHPSNAKWLWPQVEVGVPVWVLPSSEDCSYLDGLPKAEGYKEG